MNLEDIAGKLSETEARSKSNTKRLDKMEKRQDDIARLVQSVSVLANEQEHIKGDIREIKVDVKTLTDKPVKRWETVVEKMITAALGGIIGYVLFKLGLG